MTFLVSSDPLLSGQFAVRAYPGFGILGADIPNDGDNGASPVLNDSGIISDGEYYWFAETLPTSGTLTLYPDLTFTFEGAVNGVHTWTYRVGDQDGESATAGMVTIAIGSLDGSAVGTIKSITVTPPTATALGSGVYSGSAVGELPSIVISALSASALGTATGDGAASGALPVVSLMVPLATAIGTSVTYYPDPADVRLGTMYGPTGTEYTGTMAEGGGSYPTAEQIAAAVLAALNATTIPVDVRKTLGEQIVGSGTEADPWRRQGVEP